MAREDRFKVDARGLAETLRQRIEGELRFDTGARALYATDASNHRSAPIGVVVPRTIEDVRQTVAVAREFPAPLLPRGGGTGRGDQACNVAVVIDFTRHLHRVIEIRVPQQPRRESASASRPARWRGFSAWFLMERV